VLEAVDAILAEATKYIGAHFLPHHSLAVRSEVAEVSRCCQTWSTANETKDSVKKSAANPTRNRRCRHGYGINVTYSPCFQGLIDKVARLPDSRPR